ncbi:MAG: 4Fe-4S dicluster domain-containing protein [Anaerolineaceae bacterium]
MEHEKGSTLRDVLIVLPGCEKVDMCFSCGTCVSRCPIQQKVEPAYNPRRLLKMIALNMQADSFSSITPYLCSACDLCFEACPQEIHISAVLTGVKKVALESGFSTPLKTAKVDAWTCVGCGFCEKVCPYQAITLKETNVPLRGKNLLVAEVDNGKCMACGICSAICRSNSIELQARENSEEVVENLWSWFEMTKASAEK